jgi:hypothetical protein
VRDAYEFPYARPVRALAVSLVALAASSSCRPSATVERTMPVANLQTYGTVALRVHTSAFAAQGQAMFLEQDVISNLKQKCGFTTVDRASGAPADLVLDLNIVSIGRGSGGWVSTGSTAYVETLLVLTDGVDGQLLGTAKIKGKSGGVIINNAPPERDAIGAVAKSVGDLLAKSGCAGARIARAEPQPIDTGAGSGSDTGSGSAGPVGPDESKRPEAEALNDAGKEKLYAADMATALSLFEKANATLPDAKYELNICIALGALERWDAAIAACNHAKTMNPSPSTEQKIDNRLTALKQRQ